MCLQQLRDRQAFLCVEPLEILRVLCFASVMPSVGNQKVTGSASSSFVRMGAPRLAVNCSTRSRHTIRYGCKTRPGECGYLTHKRFQGSLRIFLNQDFASP